MKKVFFLLALLCLILSSSAQSTVKLLAIGDSIPDTPFEYFNYSQPTGNFADLRDGFVIFDFWRPSCLPCVKNLPKLDSLQRTFTDLQVFLISNTSRPKMEKFNTQAGDTQPWLNRLNTIINDTTFRFYFSFKTIPTYVWVRRGVLWAVTDAKELTADRIKAFMVP